VDVAAEAVVGDQQEQGVGDQVCARGGAGPDEEEDLLDHLLVCQACRVGHQPGGDVVAGTVSFEAGQGQAGCFQVGVRLGGILGGVEELGDGADDRVTEVEWAAEHVDQHLHGQRVSEVGDEVGAFLGDEAGEEIVGDAGHACGQGVGVDPFQAVGNGAAQPGVGAAVEPQCVLPGLHHHEGRAVGGHLSFPQGLPVDRVLKEHRGGVSQQVQGGAVGGGDVGVDATVEFAWRDRPLRP